MTYQLDRFAKPPRETPPPALSLMEQAPGWVIYALHGPYTLYLMARYRGVTLPTIANPGLEAGGLTGESKSALMKLLGPTGRAHFAAARDIQAGPNARAHALAAMASLGLDFPVVVKPDIGRRGFGVKTVADASELDTHLRKFAPGVRLLIQAFVQGPGEASVFYVRRPGAASGRVSNLTLKHFPAVTGDGRATLRELIHRDPRASAFAGIYERRNRRDLERVLPSGEQRPLVSVGNHVRGAAFEDGTRHLTPAMVAVIDRIAQELPGYHIGRIDLRYTTLEALKRGEEFSILEINGAGGEPTHIWDPRSSVRNTYAALLGHWGWLYKIGAENRRRGAVSMPFPELARRYLNELKLLKSYPDEE